MQYQTLVRMGTKYTNYILINQVHYPRDIPKRHSSRYSQDSEAFTLEFKENPDA